VIGMGVGFQQPLHLQTMSADEGEDLVGLRSASASSGAVVIEHRIDDCTLPAIGLVDHVTVGRGGGVEESFNQRGHGHEPEQGKWVATLYLKT
jgi:hypothetical protein